MRVPLPGPMRAPAVKAFAKFFNIDPSEAEHALDQYGSFNAFFTRKLKPGVRPVGGPFVHPVDGRLTEHGEVREGQLIQAKGWTYSLGEFLGDEELAKRYEGGTFFTYYLCPADYHRVHAPRAGEMYSARHIPGLLWPVNEWSVNNVQRLFNLNERVAMNFRSNEGAWSLVMVAATNVGDITVSLDPSISTSQWSWGPAKHREYQPAIPVVAGDELGIFHLGSTVICIFEKSVPTLAKGEPRAVRMGQAH